MKGAERVRSFCMCGLCGEITFDGTTADTTAVARMVEALVPRGPDGQGSWSNGRVAFGHRRLSVIDLSTCGSQPMVDNELGLTAVFNGCIYDYQELRAELEGHGYRFFSHSDTEVILKGYHHWGPDVVSHLHGMFAFVIAERDTGRVVMARDRLGIKPLYLAETPGKRLRFASTLPALLKAGDVDTSIDPVALHHYLTWHAVVPAPRTILNGVRKLPPATLRIIEADGTSTERRYWNATYERRAEHATWSARDWEDAIEEALRVAVRRRLVADIPVGVLLSGGLDSSLIVGLLAQEGQTGLATYSIGFESVGGHEGDEFAYSDVIAEHFGTDHHRIRVGADELAGALGHAIGAMAEPMVSHDVVAFDLLSERVSQTIKVVQSGQGADEVFAGYHWYPPLAGVGREQAVQTYAKAFFDRDHAQMRGVVSDRYVPWPRTRAWPSCARTWRRPGRRRRWTPRCGWTARSCWSTTRSSASTTCPWPGAWRPGCPSWTTTWWSWRRCARRSSSWPTAARACSRRSAAGSSRRRSSTGPRATSRSPRSPTSRARCSAWSATRSPATRPATAACSATSTSASCSPTPTGN
nr:N-acetylglutaminylglutamine amidotransferase [Blastococcus sp. TML/C7B]